MLHGSKNLDASACTLSSHTIKQIVNVNQIGNVYIQFIRPFLTAPLLTNLKLDHHGLLIGAEVSESRHRCFDF